MNPTTALPELLDAVAGDDLGRARELADELRTWLAGQNVAAVEQSDQGGANRETRALVASVTADPSTMWLVRTMAEETAADAADCEQVHDGVWTVGQALKYMLADRLKEHFSATLIPGHLPVVAELFRAALGRVDWHEIATALLKASPA